jgi:hypothetical protein
MEFTKHAVSLFGRHPQARHTLLAQVEMSSFERYYGPATLTIQKQIVVSQETLERCAALGAI